MIDWIQKFRSLVNRNPAAGGRRSENDDGAAEFTAGNAESIGREAMNMARAGHAAKARDRLADALARQPDQPHLLIAANEVSRILGDHASALGYSRLLRDRHPRNWQGSVREMQDLVALGRVDDAKNAAEAAVRRHPGQFNVLVSAIDACRAGRDHESALDHAKELMKHHPDHWEGFGRATRELMALQRFDEAMALLDEGLAAHPGQPELLMTGSDIGRLAGARERSLDFARRLRDQHPDLATGFFRTAQELAALRRFDEARQAVDSGLSAHPGDAGMWLVASEVFRLTGAWDQALEAARHMLDMQPESQDARDLAIEALIALGRFDEARALFGKSTAEDKTPTTSPAQPLEPPADLEAGVGKAVIQAAWQASLVSATEKSASSREQGQPPVSPAASAAGLAVIQYWSQGEPPAEIAFLTARWNDTFQRLGLGEIQLYDKHSAGEWIARHAPDFLVPFSTAFHYAVESDVFRLAYASARECVYLDTEMWQYPQTEGMLRSVIDIGHSVLYLLKQRPQVASTFFVARSGCAYFQWLADQCRDVDFRQLPANADTVMNSFGPQRYQQALEGFLDASEGTPQVAAISPGIAEISRGDWRLKVVNEQFFAAPAPPVRLAYKGTHDAWQRALGVW